MYENFNFGNAIKGVVKKAEQQVKKVEQQSKQVVKKVEQQSKQAIMESQKIAKKVATESQKVAQESQKIAKKVATESQKIAKKVAQESQKIAQKAISATKKLADMAQDKLLAPIIGLFDKITNIFQGIITKINFSNITGSMNSFNKKVNGLFGNFANILKKTISFFTDTFSMIKSGLKINNKFVDGGINILKYSIYTMILFYTVYVIGSLSQIIAGPAYSG